MTKFKKAETIVQASNNALVLVVLGALVIATLSTGIAACVIGLSSDFTTELRWVQV